MPRNVIIYAGSKPVIWGDAAIAAPPPPAAVPQLSLIAGAVSSTVGVAATGWSVSNTGTLPALATVTVPGDVTSTFTNGQTVAAGANVAFALTALVSGAKSIALTSATPGAVITGSPATLTGVSAPPPPPPPSGTTITSLTVQSTSAATLPYSATVLPLRGTVPAGSTLRSTDDANLRASVLSTHDDGSAAVVVVAGSKAFASGASTISVQTSAASDTPLTAAAISALVSSVSVAFDGGYGTASVTDFSTPERTWWANGATICARYRVAAPTPGSTALEAVIDVHAWAGRALVEVVIENCKLTGLEVPNATPPTTYTGRALTTPAAASYTGAVVSVNGSTVATVNGNGAPEAEHAFGRSVYARGWVGGDPGLRVTQLHTDLQKHPLLFKCDQASTFDMANYASESYTPWSTGRQRASSMGAGGDHASIGPLPQWEARALQSGDHRAWNATEVSALAVLGYNINYRDAVTGLVPAASQLVKRTQSSSELNFPRNTADAMGWEVAHQPAAGLMAFIGRPSPVFIELAQKISVWNATKFGQSTNTTGWAGASALADNTTGVFGAGPYQVRGFGWSMRALSHATFLTPDGADWKAGGRYWLNRNRIYLDGWRTSANAKHNMLWAQGPDSNYFDHEASTAGFQTSAWEHHYASVEIGKAATAKLLADNAQRAAFDATADWLLAAAPRWVNEQPDGAWRFIPYKVTFGASASPADWPSTYALSAASFYTDAPDALTGTWRDVEGNSYAAAATSGNGGPTYPSYFWSALVAAVERGVSGSVAAWNTVQDGITNLNTWRAGFASDPRWGSTPQNPPGSVAMDVAANVWTPTKDGSGNILTGSWANLPLDQWCRVSGTAVEQLHTLLAAGGFNRATMVASNDKTVLSTFNAWVGGALAGSKFVIPWGGGHADSSINGVWSLALERIGGGSGWEVLDMPSNPNAPGFEWSANYRALIGTTTYTTYVPNDEPGGFNDDILPDGKPTSRHQYGGIWYDATRNVVGQSRVRKHTFNLGTSAITSARWTIGGADNATAIGTHLYYSPTNDEVVGYFARNDGDYYSWDRSAASGSALISVGGPSAAGVGVWVSYSTGLTTCQKPGTEEIICRWWRFGNEHLATYNMATRLWVYHGTVSGSSSNNEEEMNAMAYVPEWDAVLFRAAYTATWRVINMTTRVATAYTPPGIAPPYATWPGNKMFRYQARKCLVYITPTATGTDAVYVMRTGAL